MRTPTPWTLPTQPVTRALLRGAGVSDAMIRTQLAAGRLVQIRHGVFVSAEGWPDEEGPQHVVRAHAEQVANPAAVMSHESAAVAWGLRTPRFAAWHDQPVALTVPLGARATRRRTVAWHTRALPPGHVTRDKDGYALTTLARTAVDLAAGLELPEALVIVDHAARLILASFMSGEPRRKDYVNARLVGATRHELRQAVGRSDRGLTRAIALAEPCRESAAESFMTGHIVLAGLPMPLFQAAIPTRLGTFYPDFYWPSARLIGECDGAVKYTDPQEILREKQREECLRDDAYRFVRWPALHSWTRHVEIITKLDRYLSL